MKLFRLACPAMQLWRPEGVDRVPWLSLPGCSSVCFAGSAQRQEISNSFHAGPERHAQIDELPQMGIWGASVSVPGSGNYVERCQTKWSGIVMDVSGTMQRL